MQDAREVLAVIYNLYYDGGRNTEAIAELENDRRAAKLEVLRELERQLEEILERMIPDGEGAWGGVTATVALVRAMIAELESGKV